jgi:hypothetical protein
MVQSLEEIELKNIFENRKRKIQTGTSVFCKKKNRFT